LTAAALGQLQEEEKRDLKVLLKSSAGFVRLSGWRSKDVARLVCGLGPSVEYRVVAKALRSQGFDGVTIKVLKRNKKEGARGLRDSRCDRQGLEKERS